VQSFPRVISGEYLERGGAPHGVACGWLGRARRLLHECAAECVERGYLQLPAALERIARATSSA
jgi:hypothetical protein